MLLEPVRAVPVPMVTVVPLVLPVEEVQVQAPRWDRWGWSPDEGLLPGPWSGVEAVVPGGPKFPGPGRRCRSSPGTHDGLVVGLVDVGGAGRGQ